MGYFCPVDQKKKNINSYIGNNKKIFVLQVFCEFNYCLLQPIQNTQKVFRYTHSQNQKQYLWPAGRVLVVLLFLFTYLFVLDLLVSTWFLVVSLDKQWQSQISSKSVFCFLKIWMRFYLFAIYLNSELNSRFQSLFFNVYVVNLSVM